MRFESFLPSSFVIKATCAQITLFDHITIRAILMIHMPAQEVHSRQLELLPALVAVFLVEVLRGALHPLDVLAHAFDVLGHLFDALLLDIVFVIDGAF